MPPRREWQPPSPASSSWMACRRGVLSENPSPVQVPIYEKETISTGSSIGRDHLQTVNLALIALASSLNTGIQAQDVLRRRAGCLGMQVFGSFRPHGGNSVSECRPAFPGRRTGQWPGRVQLPVVAVYFPATDVPLGVIKFHIVADC